jgi:hypothetical protein
MYDQNAILQDIRNYYRQEKFQIVKEYGKKYVTGFTTINGQLNIKWLCMSTDWDDINYEYLEPIARPMVAIK